jgi:hypothetical protein
VTLEGTGSSGGCRERVAEALVDVDAPCPLTPCSFDGVQAVLSPTPPPPPTSAPPPRTSPIPSVELARICLCNACPCREL